MQQPSGHYSVLPPVDSAPTPPYRPRLGGGLQRVIAIILLCMATTGLTVWGLVAAGVLRTDAATTITQNRETLVSQEGEVVAEAFKKVSPSTVTVVTEATTTSAQQFSGRGYTMQGAGSGFIISADGYVLTNKHVVPEGTTNVKVVLADGKEYDNVSVVGRDPINDLAFLKIAGVKDLTPAVLGDSAAVEPGQKVIAIGNALGEFRNSVTMGIISGIGRPVQAADSSGQDVETLENLFQTDAAINQGNSGGPLLNLKGEVIGINTAVAEDGQGIGFAIPINDAKGVVESILEQGKIIRPYIGVRYVSLDKVDQEQYNLPVSQGAYIVGDNNGFAVAPNSPAADAGLREGDIIVAINDESIDESHSLVSRLAQFAPGDTIKLKIFRDKDQRTVEVKLGTYPNG